MVLARWVARATRAPLAGYLVPTWLLIGLAIVELDVIVDFRALARGLTAASPWAAGAFVAALGLASGLGLRRPVDDLLLGQRHAVLWRQPVGAVAWGPAAAAVVAPLCAQLAVAAGFWYGWAGAGAALVWLGLGLVPAAGTAAGGWTGRLAGIGAAVVAAPIAAGCHALVAAGWGPLNAAIAVVVWAVALPALGGVVRATRRGPEALRGGAPPWAPPVQAPLRPRGALGALVHRDALAVWRTRRDLALAPLIGVLVGVVVRLMHVNGRYAGPSLTVGALIGLAGIGAGAMRVPAAAAAALGRRFDPPEWPTTVAQRAGALAIVGGGVLAPGWAAAAVGAPPIGVDGHVRIAAFVASIGAGAAWWVASRPHRPNPGTWPYWVALCLAAACAPLGTLGSAALATASFGFAARHLAHRRQAP